MKCLKNTGGILKKEGIHYTALRDKIKNSKLIEEEKTIFSVIFLIALTIGMWAYIAHFFLVYFIYPITNYYLNYYHYF